MKVILVSGTPATGKTTLSKKLARRLNFLYFDVNAFIVKNKLYGGYDRKRKTKIVDITELNKKLIKEIKTLSENPIRGKFSKKNIFKNKEYTEKFGGILIDSHLSHYLPRKYADLCIITKCDIKELNKRLKKRKYRKSKIQENLQAEIFEVCLNEARQGKHRVLVADTTKDFNIDKLIRRMGG